MTTRRALIPLVALLAGSWTLNACARAAEPATAASALSKWQAGTNYKLAAGAAAHQRRRRQGRGRRGLLVRLRPLLRARPGARDAGKPSKPAYVEFVRVPVIWGPVHRQHAKLYYTLQALHRPELHTKVFDAIHQQGLPLSARDEVEARAHAVRLPQSRGRDREGIQRRLRLDVGGVQRAARRGTHARNSRWRAFRS